MKGILHLDIMRNNSNKTSDSYENTFSVKVDLEIWEEIVGDYIGYNYNDGIIEIYIECMDNRFKIDIDELNLNKDLANFDKGEKIGVLRTKWDFRIRKI